MHHSFVFGQFSTLEEVPKIGRVDFEATIFEFFHALESLL